MARFDKISPDQCASYKQVWAVAYKFAEDYKGKFPSKSKKALAVIFRAVILKSYAERESNLTHGEVQDFLSGKKICPSYLIDMIKIDPDEATIKKTNQTSEEKNSESQVDQPNPIVDLMIKDIDKLNED